jgi:hypothetical protein
MEKGSGTIKTRLHTLIATNEDKNFIENGRYELWQDVQRQLTVTAQQVEGQIVQCVEEAVIEITIFIPHILHHILRQQAVREVVAVVDKLRQKHDGPRRDQLFYILLRKFEHLPQCVKMLKSVPSYQI